MVVVVQASDLHVRFGDRAQHPDPFTAAMQAISDERIDQIIVSTFPGERSGWLKRDVVGRLRKETRVPVEHVVVEPAAVGAAS